MLVDFEFLSPDKNNILINYNVSHTIYHFTFFNTYGDKILTTFTFFL